MEPLSTLVASSTTSLTSLIQVFQAIAAEYPSSLSPTGLTSSLSINSMATFEVEALTDVVQAISNPPADTDTADQPAFISNALDTILSAQDLLSTYSNTVISNDPISSSFANGELPTTLAALISPSVTPVQLYSQATQAISALQNGLVQIQSSLVTATNTTAPTPNSASTTSTNSQATPTTSTTSTPTPTTSSSSSASTSGNATTTPTTNSTTTPGSTTATWGVKFTVPTSTSTVTNTSITSNSLLGGAPNGTTQASNLTVFNSSNSLSTTNTLVGNINPSNITTLDALPSSGNTNSLTPANFSISTSLNSSPIPIPSTVGPLTPTQVGQFPSATSATPLTAGTQAASSSAVGSVYYMTLLPARQSTIPLQGGRDVPNAMPGLNFRTVPLVGKQAIPGFQPVYQNLGIKSLVVTMVGCFTGTDGAVQTPDPVSSYSPGSASAVQSIVNASFNLSTPQAAYSFASDPNSYNSYLEFHNLMIQGTMLQVEINISKAYQGSTTPSSLNTTGSPVSKLQSTNGNILFTAVIRSLDIYHETKEKTWYTLTLEVTDFGLASPTPINLNNQIAAQIKAAQAALTSASTTPSAVSSLTSQALANFSSLLPAQQQCVQQIIGYIQQLSQLAQSNNCIGCNALPANSGGSVSITAAQLLAQVQPSKPFSYIQILPLNTNNSFLLKIATGVTIPCSTNPELPFQCTNDNPLLTGSALTSLLSNPIGVGIEAGNLLFSITGTTTNAFAFVFDMTNQGTFSSNTVNYFLFQNSPTAPIIMYPPGGNTPVAFTPSSTGQSTTTPDSACSAFIGDAAGLATQINNQVAGLTWQGVLNAVGAGLGCVTPPGVGALAGSAGSAVAEATGIASTISIPGAALLTGAAATGGLVGVGLVTAVNCSNAIGNALSNSYYNSSSDPSNTISGATVLQGILSTALSSLAAGVTGFVTGFVLSAITPAVTTSGASTSSNSAPPSAPSSPLPPNSTVQAIQAAVNSGEQSIVNVINPATGFSTPYLGVVSVAPDGTYTITNNGTTLISGLTPNDLSTVNPVVPTSTPNQAVTPPASNPANPPNNPDIVPANNYTGTPVTRTNGSIDLNPYVGQSNIAISQPDGNIALGKLVETSPGNYELQNSSGSAIPIVSVSSGNPTLTTFTSADVGSLGYDVQLNPQAASAIPTLQPTPNPLPTASSNNLPSSVVQPTASSSFTVGDLVLPTDTTQLAQLATEGTQVTMITGKNLDNPVGVVQANVTVPDTFALIDSNGINRPIGTFNQPLVVGSFPNVETIDGPTDQQLIDLANSAGYANLGLPSTSLNSTALNPIYNDTGPGTISVNGDGTYSFYPAGSTTSTNTFTADQVAYFNSTAIDTATPPPTIAVGATYTGSQVTPQLMTSLVGGTIELNSPISTAQFTVVSASPDGNNIVLRSVNPSSNGGYNEYTTNIGSSALVPANGSMTVVSLPPSAASSTLQPIVPQAVIPPESTSQPTSTSTIQTQPNPAAQTAGSTGQPEAASTVPGSQPAAITNTAGYVTYVGTQTYTPLLNALSTVNGSIETVNLGGNTSYTGSIQQVPGSPGTYSVQLPDGSSSPSFTYGQVYNVTSSTNTFSGSQVTNNLLYAFSKPNSYIANVTVTLNSNSTYTGPLTPTGVNTFTISGSPTFNASQVKSITVNPPSP